MATVTKPGRTAPQYVPTPEEIAAACDEIHQKRLAAFDDGEVVSPERKRSRRRRSSATEMELTVEQRREKDRIRMRRRRAAAKEAANRMLQQSDDPEPFDLAPKTICGKVPVPEGGPREMTREDIANVEFINSSDLDSVFDSLIESVSFQHALEDLNCSWNLGAVDPDAEGSPLKTGTAWPAKDVVPFRSKRR